MKLSNIKLSLNILMFALVVFINPNVTISQNQLVESIKVGLLIANNESIEAKLGAELAIEEANKNGGVNDRQFQLVTRSMLGPWGTGSKETVNLVFKEKVWAILGSHDGRNAHLVEQVAAKTRTVFLSAWASDPTLSQAFVPWYFSCVPNDIQQADALIEEIYNKRKIIEIATVSDQSYDSKMALKSLLKEIKIAGKAEPMQLFYDNSNFKILLNKLIEADIKGIILIGSTSTSWNFIHQLRQKKMNQPIFGVLSLAGKNEFSDIKFTDYENIMLVTSVNWLGLKGSAFKKVFQKKYNKIPSPVAAYAYDGMNIIIEAIRNTGLDREKIQEAMSKINYKGVTGSIQFDKKGNRMGVSELIEIKN